MAAFSRDDGESISDAWYTNDAILTMTGGKDQYTFQVVSMQTRSHEQTEIEECVIPGWGIAPIAVGMHEDTGRFSAVDISGCVRLYDTNDWSLIWKSDEKYPQAQHLAFSKDGRYLMLQSLAGTCVLLSVHDGSVVAVSSTTLPPITDSYFKDDDTLVACYTIDGVRPTFGVALISLETDCFGPIDDVFNGAIFTYKKERVFTFDRSADRVVVFHHYTLDELIELGHETIKGHELTDAERYLYRVN